MENSKKMNDFSAGEPQVLRKAEIARILNTVKQAPLMLIIQKIQKINLLKKDLC